MDFHRWLQKATTTDVSGIYTPPSSLSRTIHRSHLPLESILEVQISQNIREEVLILIFFGRRLIRKVSLCPCTIILFILA
jgi:hypothetical protein